MAQQFYQTYFRKDEYSHWKKLCAVKCDRSMTSADVIDFFQKTFLTSVPGEVTAVPKKRVHNYYELKGLKTATSRYSTPLKRKVKSLSTVKKNITDLRPKKQKLEEKQSKLEKEIRDLKKNVVSIFEQFVPQNLSDSEIKELHLPEAVIAVRCPICKDVVNTPDQHYTESDAFDGWLCRMCYSHP